MAYAGTILVIDQHQPTCEFMTIALGDLGYRVESVHTPERIYAALERQAPDLILCALDVRGVSAFDLITVLRRHGMALAVPIVIMTTDPRILDTFPTQSITGYMLKPFRLDELYETVQRYCPAKSMPLLERSIGVIG